MAQKPTSRSLSRKLATVDGRRSAVARLPAVLVLYTGGTFGMVESRGEGTALRLPKLDPAGLKRRLLKHVPELRGLARCEVKILMNCDSAHLGGAQWVQIAREIQSSWNRFDGVVLLHGTDTLAYTASALSLLLRPCLKPVIVTGAQRPLAALRSDARRNLISAVEIAAHGPRPGIQQICVFFDDQLFRGNRVRKRSAQEFGAFESGPAHVLAEVGTAIRYRDEVRRPTVSTVDHAPALDLARVILPIFTARVATFVVTPDFPAEAVRSGLLNRLDALILVVFESLTAPTQDPALVALLRAARKKGVPVVVTTEGRLEAQSRAAYPAGEALWREGCAWAGEMTPECAYVKTRLILSQPHGRRQFTELWYKDWAHEGAPLPE